VNRQIILCLTAVLVLSLCWGCGKKMRGVQIEKREQEEQFKPTTLQERVDRATDRLANGPTAHRRVHAAESAGRLADDPNLTADQKASLVAALEKMLATEQDQEAIDAGKTALGKFNQ